MKNLYTFSSNPLNSEKFVYLSSRNAPRHRVEGTQASKEKASTTEVAKTMMKLTTMITQVDKKVKHAEEKFKNYRYNELYDKGANKSKKERYTRKRKEYWNKLKEFKAIKEKMLKINEEFQNIDAIKNKKYAQVKIATLTSLNQEMDKSAKSLGIDLRQESLQDMAKIAFKSLLGDTANLSILTGIFSMMNESDKPLVINGMKITKKGNKMTVVYKKHKVEYSIAAVGKNLQWEIRDKNGKKIQQKALRSSLAGFGGGKWNTMPPSAQTYYKPQSATSFYSQVEDKIPTRKVAKKPTTTPKPTKAERKTPAKIKVFASKPKPKARPKPAPKRVAKAPAKKPSNAKVKKVKNAPESGNDAQETKETIASLNKWGNAISTKINNLTRNIYAKITMAKQFIKASTERKKMSHLTRYKRALEKVSKTIKSAKGTDKIKAINQLATVYKILPKGLDHEWASKYKIDVTAPPATVAKLTVNPAVLNKGETTVEQPKVRVAAKPQATPKKVVAQKPKVVSQLKKTAKKPKAKIEAKEKAPGLKKWANMVQSKLRTLTDNPKLDKAFAATFKKGKEDVRKFKIYIAKVTAQMNDKDFSFTKAVKLRNYMKTGFKYIYKALEADKHIGEIGKAARTIKNLAILDFPPVPKNPTAAEAKLIQPEKQRVASIDKKYAKVVKDDINS